MINSNDQVIDKKRMQTTQQVFHNLIEVVELYPDKSISKHLVLLLRSRGKAQPYEWSDEELLKHVENYKRELEEDQDEE